MKGLVVLVTLSNQKLLSKAKNTKLLRNLWADFCVFKHYVGAIPDWLKWRSERHGRLETEGKPPAELHLNIAFVTQYARARELKLAFAARRCGHRVTLIASRVQFPDVANEYFDHIYETKNVWQMLNLLEELNPNVIHLFVNYNNVFLLPILLYASSPVVYDPYDCLKGMFKPEYQVNWLELRAERMSFERADHICSRSLEPLYLRRKCSYRMPDTTFFADYCWQKPKELKPREIGPDDDLQIVYVGGVWPEDRYPVKEFGYAQFLELSRILAEQSIHFHIYPAPTPASSDFESFFSIYIEESKQNPYLHLYHPIDYHELAEILPSYDAGIHIMGLAVNTDLGRHARPKLDYSTANKLFDYIEAGLPVIIHNGRHQKGLVRHYSHVIELQDLSNARKAINKLNFQKPLTRPTIKDHAERLGRMYMNVDVK